MASYTKETLWGCSPSSSLIIQALLRTWPHLENLCCFPNSSQEMTFPTNTLLERGVIKGESERASQRKERVRKRGVSNWEQSSHCSVLYTHRKTVRKRKGDKKRSNIPHTYFFWLFSWVYGAFWSAKWNSHLLWWFSWLGLWLEVSLSVYILPFRAKWKEL